MALSSVIGQAYAKERLGTLFTSEPGHAYLLIGPSGIGKTMLAREAAKGLICSHPTAEGACGACPNCRYFEEGAHPDFRELEIAAGEKIIRVADVRSRICADVNIYPQIASRKVYLIDGDGLNEEGQNALLKTLEEPPPSVVFFITASDAGKLLKTIVSRTVVIALSPNTEQEILTILRMNSGMDETEGLFYARYANGIPGHALTLAGSPWFAGLRGDTIDLLLSVPSGGKADLLTSGYSFFESNKDHVPEILLVIQLVLRDMMLLLRITEGASLLNQDKKDMMIHILSKNRLTAAHIEQASNAVTHASQALSSNCSFESTVCQMLLSIQKELKHA